MLKDSLFVAQFAGLHTSEMLLVQKEAFSNYIVFLQALPNPDMETASMSTEFGQPQFMLPSTISQPPRSLPNSSQLLDHQALASHSHSMDEPSQPFSSSTPQILSTGMSQPYANEKPAPHIPSSEASYPQGSQPLGSLGQSLQPSHIQNTTKAGYGQSLSHLTHSKDTRSIPQNLSQTTQEARHESNSSPMAVMSRDSSQGSGGVSQGVHATVLFLFFPPCPYK